MAIATDHCIIAPRDHPGAERIAHALHEIGLQGSVVHDITAVSQPGAANPQGTLIALLTPDEKFSSALMTHIEQRHPFPLLGLVDSTVNYNCCSVLEHCSDVAFWPCNNDELGFRLAQINKQCGVTKELKATGSIPAELLGLNLIGQSPAFLHALETIKCVAGSDVTVCIYGETGTGKELAASAVHYLGNRSTGPFIPVNCGSLPETLLENELFGHERGAFTDAKTGQPGLIEQADGGTLFLDEVEDLSPKAQAALLRFLQSGEYRSLGSKTLKTANVRVVAASNVTFLELKETGRLRSDLFYRLNVLPILLPPLRERGEDILLMAEHFLAELRICYDNPSKHLHATSRRWITRNDWPGNIRELENTLHRGFLMATGDAIFIRDIAPHTHMGKTEPSMFNSAGVVPFNTAKASAIAAFEKEYLISLLECNDGNISQAARHAKKERRALGKLLKKYDL